MSKQGNTIKCCVTQCADPLDQSYWNDRWKKNETGWDTGKASPAITDYMAQYFDKNAAILIPGCGNAYEAESLIAEGFGNITLIDIAPEAVEALKEKFDNKPQIKILCEDFFDHHGSYDLIIEQTFFCAIPPYRRNEYSKKMASLLNPDGKITGVLFDKQFGHPFPPFGGCPREYMPIFEPYFIINTMGKCYNSIPSRSNSEVFINLTKK